MSSPPIVTTQSEASTIPEPPSPQEEPHLHTATGPTPRAVSAIVSPFGSGIRQDFPTFEEAFEGAGRDGEQRRDEPRRRRRRLHPPDDLDQSVSSMASSHPTTNSSLDMSIGARAALTEHLRHIARYGLDGPSSDRQQQQQQQQQQQLQNERPKRNRHPLDEEWDRLMDGTTMQHHQQQQQLEQLDNTSFSSAPLQQQLNDDMAMYPVLSLMSEDGQEAIEVLTDVSTDFFNSSRVHLLATPEKNKGLIRAVVTRDDASHDDHQFDDDDYYEEEEDLIGSSASGVASLPSEANSSMGQMNLFREEDVNTTFLSAVDLSRISGSDSSEAVRRSPDVSFQQSPLHPQQQQHPQHTQHPQQEQHQHQQHLHRLGRRKIGDKNEEFRLSPPGASALELAFTQQRTPSPSPRRTLRQRGQPKQTGLDLGTDVAALSFEALTLSPIAHQAGSAAARLLQRRERQLHRPQHDAIAIAQSSTERLVSKMPLDTSVASSGSGVGVGGVGVHPSPPRIPRRPMSTSFDRALPQPPSLSRTNPNWNVAAASTSNVNTSINSNASNSTGSNSGNASLHNRQSPNSSSPSAIGARNSDPSSHPSSLTTNSSSSSVDRRRFRTVVPSRVFLVEPTEFPMQEDSFSAPWGEEAGTRESSIQDRSNEDDEHNEHHQDDGDPDEERQTEHS